MIQVIGTERYCIDAMHMAIVLKEMAHNLVGESYNLPLRDFVKRRFQSALLDYKIKNTEVSTDHPILDNVIDARGILVKFINTNEQKERFTLIYTPREFIIPKEVFAAVPKKYT